MVIRDLGLGATAGEEAFAADLPGGDGDRIRGGGAAGDIHAGGDSDAVPAVSASNVDPISSGSGFA
jgi:hypothetical protein